MMDTTTLRDAHRTLLDAAASVAGSSEPNPIPPPGEWNVDQILAHVAIVNAATIAAISAVASGVNTTYDNRVAQDTWTIERVGVLAGGNEGLRERIRLQGEAICALVPTLSETELDTQVPARLLSGDTVLVDQPMPLRDIISGLADVELPGHAQQLLSLAKDGAGLDAAAGR